MQGFLQSSAFVHHVILDPWAEELWESLGLVSRLNPVQGCFGRLDQENVSDVTLNELKHIYLICGGPYFFKTMSLILCWLFVIQQESRNISYEGPFCR